MGILIGAERLCMQWPAKTVLSDATVAVNSGDRIGVVGRNGDGKSTLLELLAHHIEPDSGQVIWRRNLSVGCLGQADELADDDTVLRAIVGDVPEYEWASSARIRSIMEALLEGISLDALVGELSGGQRRRVDLARLLIETHDVLLLDEPTNHLDMSAIAWLAKHLKHRWPAGEGGLVVVTHDRWFLDEVCESMWEVHDGQVEPFEGGFSAYIQQRVERDRVAAVMAARRATMLRKELAWLSRGAQARSTKPKFRVAEAQALIADVPEMRNEIELKRLAVSRLGKQVIEMDGVTFAYGGGEPVIRGIDWLIGPGDRVGILGENGAGKSTLLKLMQQQLEPTSGRLKVGKSVRFGLLSQDLALLHEYDQYPVRTLLLHLKRHVVIDGKETTSEKMLERLGFESSELTTRVCDLSGGQRRRLAILCVLLEEPNVLILDEPGNDLDTDMLAVLEDLLDTWPGTLILVTHDRYLMERVTDMQYALLGGIIRHVPGGVDEYLKLVDASKCSGSRSGKALRTSGSGSSATSASAILDAMGISASPQASDSSSLEASSSSLSNAERQAHMKRFRAIERKLEKLSIEPERIRNEMTAADPSDYEALTKLQKQLDAVVQEQAQLEDEWLELADILGVEG